MRNSTAIIQALSQSPGPYGDRGPPLSHSSAIDRHLLHCHRAKLPRYKKSSYVLSVEKLITSEIQINIISNDQPND